MKFANKTEKSYLLRNKYKYLILINLIYVSCFSSITSFKLQTKSLELSNSKYFNDDPKFADSNRTPTKININMDDYDSDPINFKRFDGERKTYNLRVQELQEKYENEKKALTNVITLQLSKIAQLTEIADSTFKKLDVLVPRDINKNSEKIEDSE
jgi:hypothetical protein